MRTLWTYLRTLRPWVAWSLLLAGLAQVLDLVDPLIPVFIVGVGVLGGLTGPLSRRIRTLQRSIVRQSSKLQGVIVESLRNIELVKSLGLTFPEIRRLQEYTRRIFDLEMTKVRRVRSLAVLQGTIINVLKQSIFFILLWLIFRGVPTTSLRYNRVRRRSAS